MKKVFNPSYLCLLVAVAVVVIGYRPPERAPSVEIQNASGEVQLQNSKNGAAILQTAGLAPGRNVTGTVQLANSGSGPGALTLSQSGLVDNPGSGLGVLSSVLQLSITDVTNPSAPVSVFSGTPAALGSRPLGSMAPGQSRTYSFAASLPVGGTNALSGSAMSMRYVWTLTGDGSGGGAGGTGSGNTRPGGGGVIASKMPVSVKVNVKSALKKGVISVTVKCGQACNWNTYAAAKGKPAVRTRRKSGRVKVAGKKATIKLKLSKAGKKALAKRLKKQKTVPFTVTVKAQDPGGAWKTVKKTAKVKRPKKNH